MVYFLRHPPHAGAQVLREPSFSGNRDVAGPEINEDNLRGVTPHEPRRLKRRGRRDKRYTGQVAIWSAEEDEDDDVQYHGDERRSSLGDLRDIHLDRQDRKVQEHFIPQQYTTQNRHLRGNTNKYNQMPESDPLPLQTASLQRHQQALSQAMPSFHDKHQQLHHHHLLQEQNLKKQHRLEEEALYRHQRHEEETLRRNQQLEQHRMHEKQPHVSRGGSGSGSQGSHVPIIPQRSHPNQSQHVSTVMQAGNYALDVMHSNLPTKALRRPIPDNLDQPLLRNGTTPPISNQHAGPSHYNSQPMMSGGRGASHGERQYHAEPMTGRSYESTGVSSSGPRRVLRGAAMSVGSVDLTENRSSVFSNRIASTITFRNIEYTVKQRRWPWSKPEKKVVLNGASGIMRPGVNAIMGPTGSGKSSLLDVLAGRKDPQYLSGEVLIDGAPQPSNFKCMSGYVVQDDIVIGELTVRENLWFSASLRLPARWSRKARLKKVEDVIEELNLTKVADSKIGTELIRGVSGGERKRTNIGMELITDPSVLFLDEPTTGLDAFTASSVIKTLKNLGMRGRTIILSIHQPKYSIYKLFDTLTLVLSGHIIYHGPGDDSPIQYFKKIGYEIEDRNSPPDFFMDLMHGEVVQNPMAMRHKSTNMAYVGDSVSVSGLDADVFPIEDDYSRFNITTNLMKSWQTSNENQRLNEELEMMCRDSLSSSFNSTGDLNVSQHPPKKRRLQVSYPTSFARQLVYVTWRSGLSLLRNPIASVVQLAVYLFFGISIGVVYFGLDQSLESGIQNRVGLFFFLTLQMVFVNMGTVEVFIKERVAFIHENSSGFYRVSVYFLAKILVDMVPLKALPVILFMPIIYWMAGLKPTADAFFFYELVLVLSTASACGVAYFVSATVSVFGIASLIISMIYVFMMIFGGYLININSLGDWLSWCRYLSVFRYTISSLTLSEMNGLTFCPTTFNSSEICKKGTTYLKEQDIPYETAWNLWSNVLGLFLITLFFCLLSYIQLRRINKYK